ITARTNELKGESYESSINWFQWEWEWVRSNTLYTTEATPADLQTLGYQIIEKFTSANPAADSSRDIDPDTMTVSTGSYEPNNDTEGNPDYVRDGDTATIWHTAYAGSERDAQYLIFTFDEVTEINGMRFLQRTGTNGVVTKYDLMVRTSEDAEWTTIVDDGALDTAASWQLVQFNAVNALQVKFQVVDALSTTSTKFGAAAEVRFTTPEVTHEHSYEAAVTAPTCTGEGYTTYTCACGDSYIGDKTPATGHQHTELRDAVAADCENTGYTGDTWCTDCNTKIADGTVIAAKGHSWDSGVITQAPTETAPGVKTFTCTVCSATKTEAVEYQAKLKAPSVSLTLSTNSSGRIVIEGQIDDFENMDDYYEITGRGILYIQTSRIGTRTLTVNTSGRTRVNFSAVSAEGTFTYNLKPTSKGTSYAFRAFVIYKNTETGKTVTVYSDMIRGSYNSISG
ncbi:MAG: discoidin domain-containing protein, partial [Oscillospiraceae bacterium]|nr:discoidin domain-containing protein [Oscillospiraceae bacterium]